MTREEYETYFEELKERGYQLAGNPPYGHPYYYKVIEYRKDKYGDNRAVCQLLFYLCHPKRSIDECERIAIEFMRWVDINVDIK